MINSSTSRPVDEDQNHRIKALEINANQFYSQLKPLFAENAQLKSDLIELNVYIEERKLHLCRFLPDTGPNGEDYILAKAVGDLQQICELVGGMDEIQRQQTLIANQVEKHAHYEKNLREIRQQQQIEAGKYFNEKQLLIDQNTKQQVIHKQLADSMNKRHSIHMMKIEDLLAQLLRQSENDEKLRQNYERKLENETLALSQELALIKRERSEETDKYDLERRNYLKQLEVLSGKVKEIKQDTIDEYEFKLNQQRVKSEHQQKVIRLELSDLKMQVQTFQEKQKLWTFQQDVLIDKKYKLELENKDLRSQVAFVEQKLNAQDANQMDMYNELNNQQSKISQLRQSVLIKRNDQSAETSPLKSQSPQKTQAQRNSYKPIASQVNTQVSARSSQKQGSVNRKGQPCQIIALGNNQTDAATLLTLHQEQLSSIQEIHPQQLQLIGRETNKSLVEQETQTEELGSSSRGKAGPIVRQRTQFVQQFLFSHAETQYEKEENENDYVNFKYELLISQLQTKLQSVSSLFDLKLEQRKSDNFDLQEQLQQQQYNYESQLKQLEIELNLLHSDECSQKNQIIIDLKETVQVCNDKITTLEEVIKQFEQNQEDIHKKYEDLMNCKDEEIEQAQSKLEDATKAAEIEQARLLQLNQNIKDQYDLEITNLKNQHKLDQEQIGQEKIRFSHEQGSVDRVKEENIKMKDSINRKEQLLETYKSELIQTSQVVKYMQLELENYKKLNNIFKPRTDSPSQMLANGFFPQEIQERIKQRLQKSKISKDNPKFGFPTRDLYSMNFHIQKREKMKQARLATLNTSFDDKSIYQQEFVNNLEPKKIYSNLDQPIAMNIKVCKQTQEETNNVSLIKLLNSNESQKDSSLPREQVVISNYLGTQLSEYSDSKLMIQDIFERETTLLQRSNQLITQLANSTIKIQQRSTYTSAKKKGVNNR